MHKTTTEKQQTFRARKKAQGLAEVRGVFMPPELHKAVKDAAKAIAAQQMVAKREGNE